MVADLVAFRLSKFVAQDVLVRMLALSHLSKFHDQSVKIISFIHKAF
jgi:hypothetical protein